VRALASSVSSASARRWGLAAFCAPLGLMVFPAYAQQAVSFSSNLRVTETVSDNARLTAGGGSGTEWITQVSPSALLSARGGRVNGELSLGLISSYYANGTAPDNSRLTLGGSGRVTAWENHAYVDLSGSISRQPTFAFGAQSADTATGSGNLSDVRVFSIRPTLQGRFGSTGTLEARYSYSETDSSGGAISRMPSSSWTLTAADPRFSSHLGWNLTHRESQSDSAGRSLEQQSTRFTGTVVITPQLNFRLSAGSESNNFSQSRNRTTTNYGIGADWRPSPLTQVSATVDERFFGTGYSLSGNTRGGNVTFQGSYGKDVSSTSQTVLGAVTLYDLLMMQYASKYPDVAERSAFVRQLLNSAQPGIGGAVIGAQTVMTNGYFLDRRMQLGMTVTGVRNSLSFIGFTSDRSTLTDAFALTGNLSTSSSVSTRGATLSLNHRLTPITSATVGLSALRSRADQQAGAGGGSLENNTRIVSAGLTTSVNAKTTASLNARQNTGSGTSSYSERALIGSVAIQF